MRACVSACVCVCMCNVLVMLHASVVILGFRQKSDRDMRSVWYNLFNPNVGHSYPDVCSIVLSILKNITSTYYSNDFPSNQISTQSYPAILEVGKICHHYCLQHVMVSDQQTRSTPHEVPRS